MSSIRTIYQDNVNGVNLALTVQNRCSATNSKRFTITYKNKIKKSFWPIKSLVLAFIFNLIGLSFVRISLTALSLIIIVISVLVLFWITHSVQSESILVIPTIGVQTSVKYVIGREDNFVPWSIIDDVIINEVIKLNRVLYFLTIITKTNSTSQEADDMKLIPLFKYTKPRLGMLEIIFSEMQVLLTSRDEQVEMGSGDAE